MKKNVQKKLPTVTVALSAYNEAQNIKPFLESVLWQKEDGFLLKSIWVYNDGSTDETAKIIKSIKSDKIIFFDDKKRLGKSTRLNDIYSNLKTDILVQTDSDVIFSHPLVIHDIIQPLLKEKQVGMCGGHQQPLPGTTFTERAVNCTVEAYIPLRQMLRGGNNIFSVDGRLLAYKKELVKKILVPENMTSNDKFTYYSCLTMGYQYRYVPSAVTFYRSPQNLKDQIRQNGRFAVSPIRMSRYFGEEIVRKETFIPLKIIVRNTLLQFMKHPIMCSYVFLINAYCRFNAKQNEKKLTAKWPMAYSTKKLS
jgi:glycosyltransferase involved in cell wall biosynthesis